MIGWETLARTRKALAAISLAVVALALGLASADEGGVSFWIPGTFGSLAAVPQQQPGWAVTSIYYHTSVSAGGDVALGRVPANLTATMNSNPPCQCGLGLKDASCAFAQPRFWATRPLPA